MFRQLNFSEWSGVAALVAFVVCFVVFAAIVIGTIRCSKRKIEYMENLPLDDEKKDEQ